MKSEPAVGTELPSHLWAEPLQNEKRRPKFYLKVKPMQSAQFENTGCPSSRSAKNHIILDSDLISCPKPVADYLRKAGVVGQTPKKFAHVIHGGEFRLKPRQKWFPIEGDYQFSPLVPAFYWKASITFLRVFFVSVVDEYKNGVGRNHVKFQGLITLGDKTGAAVDESSLGRLLSEFLLVPTALVPSHQLRWEAIDSRTSKAVLNSHNMQAAAIVAFGDDGLPCKVTVDRFGIFEGKVAKRPFIVRPTEFRFFDKLLVPTRVKGSWLMDDGEFSWLDFKIRSASFD